MITVKSGKWEPPAASKEVCQLDTLVSDEAQLTGMVRQKDIPFLQRVPVDPRLMADGVRHGAKMAQELS
jgi:hypothetical protein